MTISISIGMRGAGHFVHININ